MKGLGSSRGFSRAVLSALLLLVSVVGLAQPLEKTQPLEKQRPPLTVTDLAGRSVTLPQPITRFVVSEGRYLLALALVQPENPVRGLVGMMKPLTWTYPELNTQLQAQFPAMGRLEYFGQGDSASVSAEKIIALAPQLAIFGLADHGPGPAQTELIQQLEKAGTQVVFIDFRLDPLHHTVPSLALLGQVLGAQTQQRADAFIAYYQQKRTAIEQKVASVKSRPRVFLQAHAGRFKCCVAMADGMLGPFIDVAGGTNIADAVAPGPTSRHTLEFLLQSNPDVWIGTASATATDVQAGKPWVGVGPDITAQQAQRTLSSYLAPRQFQALDAVANGRAHAIWHDFYNSPLNIVALEAFAQWLHPALFRDVNPDATMAEIYQRFLPFSWSGSAAVSLPPVRLAP